jgi:hypothetical protein
MRRSQRKGDPRVGGVLGGAAVDLELGLLQDVGGIDAALEPAIQSEPDHPPQPVAIAGEQLGEGVRVPGAGAAQQVVGRARVDGHGRAHKEISAARARPSTARGRIPGLLRPRAVAMGSIPAPLR